MCQHNFGFGMRHGANNLKCIQISDVESQLRTSLTNTSGKKCPLWPIGAEYCEGCRCIIAFLPSGMLFISLSILFVSAAAKHSERQLRLMISLLVLPSADNSFGRLTAREGSSIKYDRASPTSAHWRLSGT